jgi:hypothetical protein
MTFASNIKKPRILVMKCIYSFRIIFVTEITYRLVLVTETAGVYRQTGTEFQSLKPISRSQC